MKLLPIILGALLALLPAATASAAAPKITKPSARQVVIIASVNVAPAIEDEFFRVLAEDKDSDGRAGKEHELSVTIVPKGTKFTLKATYPFGTLGELGMVKLTVPDDRTFTLFNFGVRIFGNERLYFELGGGWEIAIPEGAQYVYLWTRSTSSTRCRMRSGSGSARTRSFPG